MKVDDNLSKYSLLSEIDSPEKLKHLNAAQQKQLCAQIRRKLITTISKTGGHLASNLGAVELTVALHTVFDLPMDTIVWDVGHQCYTHKLLTGRLRQFSGLRQKDGLSGFPRPAESEYDAFIAGHASTAVSAAFGIAKAKKLNGDSHHTIAVVGDGALTGGMVYEAMNNAGRSKENLIVVLNDNEMSISRNVGSLARYLAEKRTSKGYLTLKDTVEGTLVKVPVVGTQLRDVVKNSKNAFRQAIYHSNWFEDLGFDYLGPVDGHDIPKLIQVFRRAQQLSKPVVVHVNTVKGKGYLFAEKNPADFHGVGSFNPQNGNSQPKETSFSQVFGSHLTALAQEDEKICAITAAMESGTGLGTFARDPKLQNRFFDVGIAEQHAVTFACGLATGGMLPVFAVYSTFLQRGYDQVIHDAAIDGQHIVLAVDRAGIVGDDGETHQGLFDAAFLSGIPNMTIYSPATNGELMYALEHALYDVKGIAALRYPRGSEELSELFGDLKPADYHHLKFGGNLLIITYGRQIHPVCQAVEAMQESGKIADILKLHKIAPIPQECLAIARQYSSILFVEEGVRSGGIGEHFCAALSQENFIGRMHIVAVDNPFLPQMDYHSGLAYCGLDAANIIKEARKFYI